MRDVGDTSCRRQTVRRVAEIAMKTIPTFKASWFWIAIVAAIALAPLLAAKLSNAFGLHFNPVTLGFACVGFVAVVISILFENRRWE